jgi:hypothetical protein
MNDNQTPSSGNPRSKLRGIASLKDYHTNLERDWFFPLQCASAAFAEYNFRKEYGLKQIIDGVRALQYGSFLEIVSKGHKDPLEEWEKTYKELFPLHS